jgi:hypothetical protein
LRFL